MIGIILLNTDCFINMNDNYLKRKENNKWILLSADFFLEQEWWFRTQWAPVKQMK